MSLEYDKLIQYIKEVAHSQPGVDYLSTFAPSTDLQFITQRQRLITDIQKILVLQGDYDFRELVAIETLFTEVQTLAFNFEEFKAIVATLTIGNIIHDERKDLLEYVHYAMFTEGIVPQHALQKQFYKIFDFEGNVQDTASPELNNIRKTIRRLKERIQGILNAKLNDAQMSQYLQDKVATKRDERYVIPVKESFAYMVEGISHGRSSSGASVFIEPKEVVPLNNELNDLFSAEKAEIYRIFCEYTKALRAEQPNILHNFEIISKLDAYFACGKIANELHAIAPEIVQDNIVELQKARHPLLILKFRSVQQVIPFNLALGKAFNVLLVSGPNTGGKTIMLKTVGLCTMMALSGLPIPADFGSKIGLFANIFSDIGDNQSIESSLSTFSGHIKNIRNIIENGNENTLVLIDEIGSATDPEQGAALAQAILEQLVEKQMRAVITTHYTTLKIFAENNPQCKNASMQFDAELHEPTYQFILGFPGNSFAIDIASKLGLQHDLIERASQLAGSQNVELTELLNKMNAEKQRLSQNNYQLELKQRLQDQKVAELQQKITALESEKKAILKKVLDEAQEYLITTQKTLNNELTELKELTKEDKRQKIAQMTKEIQVIQTEIRTKRTVGDGHDRPASDEIAIGDTVWLTTFETKAHVIDIQKEVYKVDMNGISFECKQGDMYKMQEEQPEKPVAVASQRNTQQKGNIEINLLGKTFDEALPLVIDLIDNALLSGLHKVRIIHGRGTGALRKKIRDYLRSNKKVQDFFSPPQEAGGDGVTVVVVGG